MAALYQKYRPLCFADIIGQEAIKTTLKNEIASGTTVHAYLFSGPRAVGKTTTARILARAINCVTRKEGESEPCNICPSCEAMLGSRTFDVLEIDAASHTGVDNVRDLIMASARVATTQLRVRVFILDEVHMLSTAAFNALLKTLEEPPLNVVFILATTELHKVPATIISRCQRFDFKKIDPDLMLERLKEIVKKEKKQIDEEILLEIIHRTGGCARDAESLLGQVLSLDESKIDKELAAIVMPRSDHALVKALSGAVLAGDAPESLRLVRQLMEGGIDISTFTNDLIDYFRNLLLISMRASSLVTMTKVELGEAEKVCKATTPQILLRVIDYLILGQKDVKWFTLPHLPLEVAVVKGCLLREEK